ncbi:MAG: efflux RND transporter permease subunit [Gemmatimonadetes bacterium]|nr:efflux RND transporter permease subunit [Gemmatimonadota bacterium]
MRIAEFSVKNRPFTIVAFIALLAMGLNALLTIPRTEDPSFPFPNYTIVAVYPGAGPTDMEQLIIDPIEKRLRALDDVARVKTFINDGAGLVNIEFDFSVDADKKYDEVLREVNSLRASLPPDLARLDVMRFDPSDVNITQVALVSDSASYTDLDRQARALRDELEKVPGIKRSQVWAYPRREVRVAIDLGRLSTMHLALGQVLNAIGSESANIPGGSIDAGGRKFNVKTNGSYRSIEQVRETVVGGGGGAVVRLGDVAQVTWDYEEQAVSARFDGHRAVWVTANMKDRQNILAVRDSVYARLATFEKRLPRGMAMGRGFDQSANVRARIGRLSEDFLIAILLVIITLLPLGWRASGIVMVSIPLSLAIGITLLKLTGFSINQISISGFVVALGLLVDDSIVVVENISRFLREGYSRAEAAIAATQQIFVAVLGTTATLVFAFVPILMLPEGAGEFIRGLPAAVVFTILASLLVSLTVVPFLASFILREQDDPHGNRALQLLNRGIELTYSRFLHRALARPKTAMFAAVILAVASLGMVPFIGFSLFPKAGTPQFMVTVRGPDGASLATTDSAVRFVERALNGRPGIQHVYANIGRGNPVIYYNVLSQNENTAVGDLFVLLDRYDGRQTPAMLDSLRAVFDAYPSARIEVKEFENGPPIDAPIAVRIHGRDLDTLRLLAEQLEHQMDSTTGTRTVVNPLRVKRTDLRVDVDRGKAGLLGIPMVEVDRTVRLGIAGLSAGRLRDSDGQEYDVTVRLPRGERQTADALAKTYVTSVAGNLVPLSQIASLRFESSPPVIQHYDGERSVTVTAQTRTGFNTDRVTQALLAKLEQWKLPVGYTWRASGEVESRRRSFGGLGTAILIAIFGILAILVLEFKTFRGMLIVASVIPLGVVGGLTALLASGYTLSFTAMIGFVALVGIEIKNSILLVDFTNQLREQGLSVDDAVERAGKIRFLPVVLTTCTAIGGLLPLALQGSGLYSPMAWVIIGGLVSSTLLARVVTPVMYKLMPPSLGEA